jgi:menaquinone-dependent protoporphyrinogen oxidase
MAKLLIVYGTGEGHTRRIAERIAAIARDHAHVAHVHDAALHPALDVLCDAVVVAASVHQAHHQPAVVHFARQHRDALRELPTAFFSVSLTAAFPGRVHHDEAMGYVESFIREAGWRPGCVRLVAGALRYTQYDFMKRTLARLIATEAGAVTDTSRDVEYTDWTQLERDVTAFLASLRAPAPRNAAARA